MTLLSALSNSEDILYLGVTLLSLTQSSQSLSYVLSIPLSSTKTTVRKGRDADSQLQSLSAENCCSDLSMLSLPPVVTGIRHSYTRKKC